MTSLALRFKLATFDPKSNAIPAEAIIQNISVSPDPTLSEKFG